ncbi:MAG: ACP S-malonyltransferase [Thermoleophilia bacterium]
MIAAIFPGQGAQAVGMGADLAAHSAAARNTFEEADDVLGYALSEVCFTGPIERLTATDVCQPALVATSVAAYRAAVEESGFQPDLVLGHSLGEYSALVAAGAMDFERALRIVAERGDAMRQAGLSSPGAMLAVLGLSDGEVAALVDEVDGAWPANENCPGQVVVSGTLAGIDALESLAAGRGVRSARLQVDGAFHSPLMAPAAERLRPALEAWDPADPVVPFLSTTTCAVEPPQRMRSVLLDQLTSPVRFGPAVGVALAMGVDGVVEFGPGKVLSGLVRRVRRDVAARQVGVAGDLEALAVN